MRLLSSALFWRILLSSLLVVGVLGLGLYRASSAHQQLEQKFDRLVQHDLKLADDAEVLLRMMADLETGKRGFLLTGDRSFLMPYDQARNDLEGVLTEAQATAENGKEDERVAAFGRLVNDWIRSVSEPQIAAKERGEAVESEQVALGKVRTDEMRAILTELRNDAIKDAREQQAASFKSVEQSRRETTGIFFVAIVLALASGIWIARDLASATSRLEEALEATGKLEALPALPDRRDELGAVGRSLSRMAALLHEKDGSLRRTLAEREATLEDLTRANAELAARDEEGRAYAEFVRELKTLDVTALSTSGLRGLVRLAGAHVGAVFLLDSADRLVPVHACSVDGRALDTSLFGSKGLPQSVMETREPTVLDPSALGEQAPELDIGFGKVRIGWVLGQPIAVGEEGAGAVILGRTTAPSDDREQLVHDAARQFAVGLHNAWTHARLREKTNILAEQGETLTRANRVKTEFLASMSHELRTPLNAIIGFADLLLASQREELSPRTRESLERIRRNGMHLLTLINDVLDLAKAESGRVDVRVEVIDASHLVRACVAEVDSLRQGKTIELVVDAPPALEMTTDPQRLRQILLNLLSNAIKFTEEGEVKVIVTTEGAEVRIAVNDTGLGIPEHQLPELFREFGQLDTGDGKRYAGTGIGLALSRRLARALGGEIDVTSTIGKGSTFRVVLPRVRRESPLTIEVIGPEPGIPLVTAVAERESLNPESGDVLVVDDFPDTLALYEALLGEDGHRVRTAVSGVKAMALVEEREPEVVLLDVSMPGMDGYEVLKRLRARRGGGPAVLMLTAARRDPVAIEHGLREGADAYMTKPIESRELRARVRGALEAYRLKRMIESQRRDHIAMLVHDLRHPLASLGLLAEVLQADDLTADERRSSVVTIRTLCADMSRLVDSVLAASRLEAGVFSVDPRPTTARAILEPTIASLSPVATRRHITLVFEGNVDAHLAADAIKLRQAIDNLVANALKFTPRGGRVRVAVEMKNNQIIFEVSDSGPGIPAGERASIFDRYGQGKTGRTAGGAGLGLAIAKGIAEAHRGSITVGDSPLGGAAFRLSVPA